MLSKTTVLVVFAFFKGEQMKILIIGYSGGGKSTLANFLSDYYSIPKLHLDQVYFLPNWRPRPEEEFNQAIKTFLASHQDWVIDGVYSRFLFKERLDAADQIIFLDFSRWTAFVRLLKRFLTYHGKTRPSAPVGCKEKFDWAFIKFVLLTSRKPKRQELYSEISLNYPNKFVTISNQKELDGFYLQYK